MAHDAQRKKKKNKGHNTLMIDVNDEELFQYRLPVHQ